MKTKKPSVKEFKKLCELYMQFEAYSLSLLVSGKIDLDNPVERQFFGLIFERLHFMDAYGIYLDEIRDKKK